MRHLSAFASPTPEPSKLRRWMDKHGIRTSYKSFVVDRKVTFNHQFGFALRTTAYEDYVSVTLALGWPFIHFTVSPKWLPKSMIFPRHQGLALHFLAEGFAFEIDGEYYSHRYFWSPFHDLNRYLALDETWKPCDRTRYDNDDYAWFEHPYIYVLPGGAIQKVTATVRRTCSRVRWHWFGGKPSSRREKVSEWFRRRMPFGNREHHYIDVTFSDEVGPQAGSYKGGVIQTSFRMKDDEYAEKALYRMMREKVFR